MRDFLVIKDPQVAKLFADPTRRDILHNLRHREMSPFQLAKILSKHVSSISYHLNALEEAGLVELSRTEVKGNLVERFYRATARKFIISYTLSEGLVPGSEDVAKWTKEMCHRAATNLAAFGYSIPPVEMDEWAELIERYAALEKAASEEVISGQISPTCLESPVLKLLLDVLTRVHLHRNPEYFEIIEKISQKLSIRKGKVVGR
ncbi:MAG: helix-turn-helix domain-containing protein [Candidatus Bathyarchaeia archaeon]